MTPLQSMKTTAKSICLTRGNAETAAAALIGVISLAVVTVFTGAFLAERSAEAAAFSDYLKDAGLNTAIGRTVTLRYTHPVNIHHFAVEKKVRITDTWWKPGKDGLAFCAAGVSETGGLSACVRPATTAPLPAPAPKVGG